MLCRMLGILFVEEVFVQSKSIGCFEQSTFPIPQFSIDFDACRGRARVTTSLMPRHHQFTDDAFIVYVLVPLHSYSLALLTSARNTVLNMDLCHCTVMHGHFRFAQALSAGPLLAFGGCRYFSAFWWRHSSFGKRYCLSPHGYMHKLPCIVGGSDVPPTGTHTFRHVHMGERLR